MKLRKKNPIFIPLQKFNIMNVIKLLGSAFLILSTSLFQADSVAQERRDRPTTPAPAAAPAAQPTPPAAPPAMASRPGPKPYKEIITAKAKSSKGLFTVHKIDDKYYFELDEKLFDREIMAITRFTKVAGGGGVYGGELANQQVVKFTTVNKIGRAHV